MNTIDCCGQTHRAPFCSMCGRRLQAFPLSDLMVHCRVQADKSETALIKLVTEFGVLTAIGRPDIAALLARRNLAGPLRGATQARALPASDERDLDKARNLATQWRSWAAALEALMRHATTLPPTPDLAGPPDVNGTRNMEI